MRIKEELIDSQIGSRVRAYQENPYVSDEDTHANKAVRQDSRRGRKKAAVVDLSTIIDPTERRRQRRLLKNRMTAAASR